MDVPLKIISAVTSSKMALLILMSFRIAKMCQVVNIFLEKFATLCAMPRVDNGCLMAEFLSVHSSSISCSKESCMRLILTKITKHLRFNTTI
jgi:hypothetical protein